MRNVAHDARVALADAERLVHESSLRYIRDAKAAGWSWARIGGSVGLTGAWARTYWKRHGMAASRMGAGAW